MPHRTLCLTYQTMIDEMPFLEHFVEHVSAAPSLLYQQRNQETCARHSAEAKRPHALLLHCLRSHMLTSLSRPTCRFAWHADPPCRARRSQKSANGQSFFHLFWCVRCALACVIKTKSEHLNLLELLSECASFCIGPECPSSPIRRQKKSQCRLFVCVVQSAKGQDSTVGGGAVVDCLGVVHMEEEVQDKVQVEVRREEQGVGETHGKEQGEEQRENRRSINRTTWMTMSMG